MSSIGMYDSTDYDEEDEDRAEVVIPLSDEEDDNDNNNNKNKNKMCDDEENAWRSEGNKGLFCDYYHYPSRDRHQTQSKWSQMTSGGRVAVVVIFLLLTIRMCTFWTKNEATDNDLDANAVTRYNAMRQRIVQSGLSQWDDFTRENTPQHNALLWLSQRKEEEEENHNNKDDDLSTDLLLERYSLAVIFFQNFIHTYQSQPVPKDELNGDLETFLARIYQGSQLFSH